MTNQSSNPFVEGIIHKQFLFKQLRERVQTLLEHDIKHVISWNNQDSAPTEWLSEISSLLSLEWKLNKNMFFLKKVLENEKAKVEVGA